MTISDIFDPPQETECVLGEDSLKTAMTSMTTYMYSQLLVVRKKVNGKIKKSQLLGCISWNSIGTTLLNQDVDLDTHVKNFLEPVDDPSKFLLVRTDENISDVAKKLMEQEYVIAYDENEDIQGFITAYNIAKLYLDMVMPYTEIQKIEVALREILSSRLSFEDIKEASKTSEHDREFDSVEKMMFSEYITVFRKRWDALNLRFDKNVFVNSLETIREIRNRIMHFNMGKMTPNEQKVLTGFGNMVMPLVGKS